MSDVNVSELRRLLETKYDELSAAVSNRDGIVIETTADEMERLQQHLGRDIAIHNLDRTSTLLKSIRAALDRIDDERYGVCVCVVKSRLLKSASTRCHGPRIVSTVRKG